MRPLPSRFGKYDLLAQLATGGMAEIWLARVSGAAGFEKLVVIKRLLDELAVRPEYVEMFLDEARINARLSHSNVVQVLELGQVESKYFMAMEYVAGLSVAQVGKKTTQRLGDVPQEIACGIVVQACTGLHYAHERTLPDGTPLGIIHRDVSPQNLILTFEGLVKVLDFGIAKAEGRTTQTRAGFVKGKSSYMSPEQCLGLPLDRRTDVFALGIILYELCTARRLFKRANPFQTFQAITRHPIPPPRALNPKINPDVEAIIYKALAKSPNERFETAAAMQDALEQAMHKHGLRGAPKDLARFVEETFAPEITEQGKLLAGVQRGGSLGGRTNAVLVSAVAEQALAEQHESNYASDASMAGVPPPEEATTIDQLPPLGEESGRSLLTPQEELYNDGPTQDSKYAHDTEPAGVPSMLGQTPPLYYGLAVLGALLIAVALVWLIAY